MRHMDTAPKDGTAVLLYVRDKNGEMKWIEGYWWHSTTPYSSSRWELATFPIHGCGCCGYNNETPAGWLPLPSTEQE